MFVSLLTSNLAFARIHEFETTHLKSQAGTGASGIFMEEAAFLNPSTLAFFTQGSAYFQRDMMQIKNAKGDVIQKPKNTAVVLADGNPTLSGSLSYVAQEEGSLRRKRWGLSTSSPLSDKSAFGVSIRRTKDENLAAHTDQEYWQTVFGITHAIDPRTSLGLVAYDAFNSKGNATKAIVGAQHIFVDYITLSFDIGGNYKSDEISDSLLYRGSIQVRVLNDIYLRFGGFSDKEFDEKGSGFGVGWNMPRMNLEFALKNTKQTADASIGRPESKIKEASFAAGLRF